MVEVARLNESPLNISGQPENDSNIQNITSLSGAEADPNIQNQDGKTLSYDLDLNKKLSDILGQLESDINLLDRPNNIQYIISLLQAGADPNTKGQDGKTLLHYLNERLSDILDQLESNSNSLDNYIQYIISLLEAGADRNTQNQYGKTLSHYSNEPLLNILNALESNGDILDNYLPYIMSLLQAGADPNTKGQNGKTLLYYLDEKLLNILNNLADNGGLLDNLNYVQYISLLLEAGADRNTQNQYGKTLSYYLNEKLLNILDQLESNLDHLNNTLYICFLLNAGADPNIQNQYGKTLSYYLDKHLLNILNDLENDSDLLNYPNNIKYIGSLLEIGANPNIQNQAGKTLLHYVAERNGTGGIEFLLKAGANPSIRDQSGKTPFEYVTEHSCLQALKHWGYNLDDSHENEGNPATPDSSVGERKDCSNSSGDDNKTISTEPSDCAPEDKDSSCSSSDYLFLEDSLLAKLEIPLTTDEQNLIGKFCKKIENTITENKQKPEESILKSIEETVNNHLNTGARLNSLCCNECKSTVTNLILEKIGDVLDDRVKPRDETREYRGGVNDITNQDDEDKDEALDIIGSIIRNLLLKGGKAKEEFFYTDTELANNCGFDCANLSKECVEIKNKLKSIAYEGIVNKNEHAQKGEPEEVDIDNIYFYIKYPQDSIIEPVKIFNKAEDLKDKALNLKVGILKIGKSEVRVKSVDGKRNYTNISGSIEMSFTTEAGEISIYLHREKDSNKIEVEIDDESKAKLNKLKAEKKSLGENCLLGGKSVLKAIEDKGFEKNGSVSTETTKDDLSTNLTQVRLQQNREVALGG